MSFDSRLQVSTLARLLTTVALDVGSARLAHGAAVGALRDGTALFVDVLKRTICKRGGAVRNKLQTKRREAGAVHESVDRTSPSRCPSWPSGRPWVAGVRWAAVGVGLGRSLSGSLAPPESAERLTRVLAVADTVPAHACLAGVLFAVNYHCERMSVSAAGRCKAGTRPKKKEQE